MACSFDVFAQSEGKVDPQPKKAPLSESLTPAEREEIKRFTSLELGKGNLLTPPRGSIQPRVLRVRRFVKDLIMELAGPKLEEKGIHFVVNVYAQPAINAWVMQMNPQNDGSQEADWKKNHPDQPWPLRRYWGFADDGKPIYELAVTSGLINQLQYKDEVAFILGHELNHLFEGHTDSLDNRDYDQLFKKWWSSQSHEMVADNLGVDIILGK